MSEINYFRINTSAWEEEDFIIRTDLNEQQVRKVIQPLIDKERDDPENNLVDNEELFIALYTAYPQYEIELLPDDIDILDF